MEQYDLVILGGGLAGMCAAVEAGEQGANVLLLEKQDELGGSTVLSSGYMAFAGTNMQEQAGIVDTTESLVDDLIEVGGGVNEKDLVEAYGLRQLDTYKWLLGHGVEFRTLEAVSGHSVPRGHVGFFVESWDKVLRSADIVTKNNVPIALTPQRHGITRGLTTYFFDPSGNCNEAFASGYITYPDFPTVTWTEDTIDTAFLYHNRKPAEALVNSIL